MTDKPKIDRGKAMTEQVIALFKSGKLPQALSQTFIDRGSFPCDSWSWMNKLFMAVADTTLAMGFKQWLASGRCVNKGCKAFYIYVPFFVKDGDKRTEDGKQAMRIRSFGVKPAFRFEDTTVVDAAKWAKVAEKMASAESALQNLPFRQVADAWGIPVTTYSGKNSRSLGWYCPGNPAIGVGVENPATFAHELIHCADSHLGNLKERGQHWRSETVAELGGAALLYGAGFETDADLGGAFEYITNYAKAAGIEPIKACQDVIDRIGKAVQLVIDAAAELKVESVAVA